jgi:aspartyl-tRNA(Asn)/glutamyl-tRNA(Gln) amidotransferase subunit C
MADEQLLELVRRVGKLSRIELSDADVATFAPQLGNVLVYFDKLKELDTEKVQPMAHALDIANVLADDVPGQSLTPEQALANAPRRDGDFFMVPKVIGESS